MAGGILNVSQAHPSFETQRHERMAKIVGVDTARDTRRDGEALDRAARRDPVECVARRCREDRSGGPPSEHHVDRFDRDRWKCHAGPLATLADDP